MKKQLVFSTLLVLFTFGGEVANGGSLSSSYDWKIHNGHSYALTNIEGAWQDAEQEAVAVGGHLVTINDQSENDFLFNTFQFEPGVVDFIWIGLWQDTNASNYSEPRGGWKWSDGTIPSDLDYEMWGPGEPNNMNGEDYGVMRAAGEWNDLGTTSGGFPLPGPRGIIELSVAVPATHSPEPSTLTLGAIGLLGLLGCGRRRQRSV